MAASMECSRKAWVGIGLFKSRGLTSPHPSYGFKKWQRIVSSYWHISFCQKTPTSFLGHQKYSFVHTTSARCFTHLQDVRKVYYLENTEDHCFKLEKPYKTLDDIKLLGVKTVTGGFRRRPELIREKPLNLPSRHSPGLQTQSYGLFDKCERIQQELIEKVLCLMDCATEESSGCLMLDIGCGHGWSLSLPSLKGFCVTGVDLDLQGLSVIQNKAYSNYLPRHGAHVVRADVSNGLSFKESIFDIAISISFLQWLCVGQHSRKILQNFFRSLSFVLKHEGKAGMQFYPRNSNDVDKVVSSAQNYFKGVLVSDFPHLDRGRKLFLLLSNNK